MFKNFKKHKNNYSQVDNIINIHNITNEDALKILSNEFVKIQNEIYILQLIYRYHDDDSYENTFNNKIPYLEEKKEGIRVAIKNLKYNSDSDSDIDSDK